MVREKSRGGMLWERIGKSKYDQNTVYEILTELMFSLRINLGMTFKTDNKNEKSYCIQLRLFTQQSNPQQKRKSIYTRNGRLITKTR